MTAQTIDAHTLTTRRALQILADQPEPLALEGAWRLDHDEAQRLREEHDDNAPAGGWKELASLAAGAGILAANRDSFEADIDPDDLNDWTDAETRRRLLEAFSKRLVPPTTAAGLFIMLGLHPAWGVHLAHRTHRMSDEGWNPPERSPSKSNQRDLFDPANAEAAAAYVSRTLRTILDKVADFGHGTHSTQDLAQIVGEACDTARAHVEEEGTFADTPGLNPLVDLQPDGRSKWRVIDFTASDLLDAYLVPAGVVTHTDGQFQLTDADTIRAAEVFADAEPFPLD